MTKEELKGWFFGKLNGCYPIKHRYYPDSIYWFYDESFVRKVKLNKINGIDIKYPTKISGVCLFGQSSGNDHLWFDYNEIWSFIEVNSNFGYRDIQILIKEFLEDVLKIELNSTSIFRSDMNTVFDNVNKLNVYTPSGDDMLDFIDLRKRTN